MEIQAVAALPSISSHKPKPLFSKTTLKTHALVVLSYVLIGIGIALACASVYMATVMHPMLAIATPAAPIAMGILLKPGESYGGIFSTSRAPVYIKGQPLGFHNQDGSTCWMNSALAVLFNCSTGKELMGNLSATNFSLFPLRSAFRNYRTELTEEGGRPTSSVSSASIRSWFNRLLKDSGSQEDPDRLFDTVFGKAGYSLPLIEQTSDGKTRPSGGYYIPLLPERGKKTPFSSLLDAFFNESPKKWFSQAPTGFMTVAYRGDETGKAKDAIDFPMSFEFSKEQCREGNRSYSPDAFILHHGSGTGSGHYTAYIHRNGYWWHVNDHNVTQVSDREAASKIQSAYIVHYAQG
ncbi:MAG: hypothetical protein P0S96_06380 [Simkaniaceae bacterium]|nr:hypothetical protein [Candidatus Sacchlamyda saccharinae]